jgi:O-Antigen ligase
MPHGIKDLIVVLALALAIFHFARPIARHFTSDADFSRRRGVWLALTVVAFLSPTFWWFVIIAAPLLIWARRRDSNPVALYLLLLHVIPSLPVAIPVIGINELFDLDNYRLLSFCILIPVALQLRRAGNGTRIAGLRSMDVLLLAFGVLHIALYIPPDLPNHEILRDSLTNVLRRALLFVVDVYALYFAVSRGCSERGKLRDAMATFCLGCAIMAVVAVFESARHWLLYADLQLRWTETASRLYLERAGTLRAQASAGHSLALGYLLAIGFGFWLYLRKEVSSRWTRLAVTLLLWLGLVSAYSRGPWLGAVAVYLTFMAVGPGSFARTFKAAAVIAVVFGAVSLTPFGDRIVSVLPFFGGSVDNANVVYRQRLFDRSWELLRERPFFGDQLAQFKLEDLRQGEGIVDFVNTYADVALSYGLVGLFCFVGFALLGLMRAYRTVRETATADPELAWLGTSLVACIAGTLFMLVDSSFVLGYEKMFYILAGLAAAYAQLSASNPARAHAASKVARPVIMQPQQRER